MESCDSYPHIANEYRCPQVGGKKKRKTRKRKAKKSVSQLGGNCLYIGPPTSVNQACAPHDAPTFSQTAWSRRYENPAMTGGSPLCNLGNNYLDSGSLSNKNMFEYGDCVQVGGDGYSVLPGRPVGGQPGFMRYSDTCRPVFPGEILPKKVGGSKKRRGIISSLFEGKKFKNKNIREMNGECRDCEVKIPMSGGALLGEAVTTLSGMLSPMGKNALVSLVVLLFSRHLISSRKMSKKQMGGNLMDYTKMLLPMTKNSLLALASILLIHHFVKNKHKKTQRGGTMMTELGSLLAPLGVNELGSSIIILLLSVAVRKGKHKNGSKKGSKKGRHKGGMDIIHPIVELVAPLGISAFASTGILVVLERIFKLKRDKMMGKLRKGGSISSLTTFIVKKT
jgi:hypothetical protein